MNDIRLNEVEKQIFKILLHLKLVEPECTHDHKNYYSHDDFAQCLSCHKKFKPNWELIP